MTATALKERLEKIRTLLLQGLVEREEPVRLALLAAIAGEHLLLLGPPGVAKSEIARRLRRAFQGAAWFERLLTKFTVPEELFGPLSIDALKQDRYHRKTERYLPTASVAFLDEIFKANSAILNSLLTLLNEKEFDNGVERQPTPLVCVIGASNELPEEEGMAALFDRFLLRCHVGSVSEGAFGQLLIIDSAAPDVPVALQLTPEDLRLMREDAARVKVPDDVLILLMELRKHLAEQQVSVSDRRWRKIVALLRSSALTNGRDTVDIWDCWLVQHCTWNKPEQRDIVKAWYEDRVGAAQGADPAQFEKLTASYEKRLQIDADDEEVAKDENGEKIYIDSDGSQTTKSQGRIHKRDGNGKVLYKAPTNHWGQMIANKSEVTADEVTHAFANNRGHTSTTAEAFLQEQGNRIIAEGKFTPKMIPRRFSLIDIDARLDQIAGHRGELGSHIRALKERFADLNVTIDRHLWVAPGFSAVARPELERSIKVHESLVARWEAIEQGVRSLPVEEVEGGTRPEQASQGTLKKQLVDLMARTAPKGERPKIHAKDGEQW